MSGLIATIERRPQAAFAVFLALHVVVWTALPAVLYPNLPLDLIEALTYGREWQLGYDKLPPLPWWLVEVVHQTGRARHRLLRAGADRGGFGLCAVWLTARPLVGARRRARRRADHRRPALLPFHGRQVQSRRHPAAVLGAGRLRLPRRPCGAAACVALAAARRRRSGCRCGRNISWSCWRCRSRCSCSSTATRARALATPGPCLALAVALAIMAPHLIWLVQTDFPALRLCERARRALARPGTITSCIRRSFALGQSGVPAAGALHRRRAALAAAESAEARPQARGRTPSTGAS